MEHLYCLTELSEGHLMKLNEQIDDCLDYVEFSVDNIERSKKFYSAAFGWDFTDFGDSYCEFSDGRMKGGFHTHGPVKPGGPLIVIYHTDLEVVQGRVKNAGGTITREIFQFPGGERFQFTDLDGYELAVWRKIEEEQHE